MTLQPVPHAFDPGAPGARAPAPVPAGPLPDGHPPVEPRRVGVLLLNLGTPDGTSYWPMRRYLKQFLSDRRVIEVPRAIWWPLLNGVILTTRPSRKGKDYASVWNTERDEGPLKTITRDQAEGLAARLGADGAGDRVVVDWAMRYANPSTEVGIKGLMARGCDRVLLVPLYPQYAAATTATACDEAYRALMRMRWQPTVRGTPPWHDDPVYIGALADSVERHLAALDFEPDALLASFHGVPRKYLLKGDPYHCHCAKTARLLGEAMALRRPGLAVTHSFQSRFGTDEWLRPYTDEVIKGLPGKGIKRLAVVAPGFAADCLETLEELDVENREYFEHAGGERFAYLPCLNADEEGLRVIEHVVRRELAGWF